MKQPKVLICTDLDFTLLRNDKSISAENLQAIARLQAAGGYFTFITGRMPFFARNVAERVRPNAPIGCINGGGLYDYTAESYIWRQAISSTVLELVAEADAKLPGLGIQINTFDQIYFCGENSAMAEFRAATKVPNLTCSYQGFDQPIAKIVFGDEDVEKIEALAKILAAHPRAAEFDFISSERTLYEILPKGSSKGGVLGRLADYLGVPRTNVIAIGDYHNDISMFRVAGIGVAVANACPAALEAADYITVSNEEHAIARVIADYEQGLLQPKSK